MLHYTSPWLSAEDIKSGDRWSTEIAKELQDTNFGIICVTSDNLQAPWLLFESGALAKSMEDGRVIPLRLDVDVSDISGPLTQFQSEKADSGGIKRLLSSLNKTSANAIPDDRLTRLFDPMWPELAQKIEAIPPNNAAQKKTRPQADILEELVAGVRTVEMRVRDISDDEPGVRRRSRRRVSPGMMMDLAHRIGQRRRDPIQFLILASLIRDDLPWLYEIAAEAYRAYNANNRSASKRLMDQFKRSFDVLRDGPLIEYFGGDKYAYSIFREMNELISYLTADMDESSDGSNDGALTP